MNKRKRVALGKRRATKRKHRLRARSGVAR